MLERAYRLLRQESPVNGKYCASDIGRSCRTSSRDAGGRQRRDHCNPVALRRREPYDLRRV